MHPIAKPPPPPYVFAHTSTKAADSLGCIIEYNVVRFDPRSFTAQIGLNIWSQGMKVLVDFGPIAVDLGGSWGADAQRIVGRGNAFLFVLRRAPDERGGFGFNGRGGFLKAATRAPDPPFTAPKPNTEKASGNGPARDCASVELKLPPLRPGCGGDEKLTVEMSDGGAWLPAVEDVKGKTVTIASLDPYVAYKFRAIAANAAGASAAGPESGGILTDAEHFKISEPPTATATSSASISVSWANSACRPQLTFEVLYARHDGGGKEELQWQILAKSVSGSSYEVQSLRCPTGCVFRVRPLELRGLSDYSRQSAVVRTKVLPRPPTGASRVELKLSAEVPNEHAGGLHANLAADLAMALEVSKTRVSIVEVRRKGLFFICDLLAAAEGPTPEELAHSLVRQVSNKRSNLFQGSLTRNIDGSSPPLYVALDGSVTQIEAPATLAGVAARITFVIASVIAIIAICTVCSRAMGDRRLTGDDILPGDHGSNGNGGSRQPKRCAGGGKVKGSYGHVQANDDLYDEEDEMDDVIEREASRFRG